MHSLAPLVAIARCPGSAEHAEHRHAMCAPASPSFWAVEPIVHGGTLWDPDRKSMTIIHGQSWSSWSLFLIRNNGVPMGFQWCSYGVPIVFLSGSYGGFQWCSYGIPMVFLWASNGFPMGFQWCSNSDVFLSGSYGGFQWCSYGFLGCSYGVPMVFRWCSYVLQS